MQYNWSYVQQIHVHAVCWVHSDSSHMALAHCPRSYCVFFFSLENEHTLHAICVSCMRKTTSGRIVNEMMRECSSLWGSSYQRQLAGSRNDYNGCPGMPLPSIRMWERAPYFHSRKKNNQQAARTYADHMQAPPSENHWDFSRHFWIVLWISTWITTVPGVLHTEFYCTLRPVLLWERKPSGRTFERMWKICKSISGSKIREMRIISGDWCAHLRFTFLINVASLAVWAMNGYHVKSNLFP